MGGKPVTEIEVREPDLGDSLEAEKEANPALQPTAFQVALACQVLVRAGDDTGPFVPAQFKGLKGKQWAVFREAMQEAEKLGKADARPRGRAPADHALGIPARLEPGRDPGASLGGSAVLCRSTD